MPSVEGVILVVVEGPHEAGRVNPEIDGGLIEHGNRACGY